MHTLFSPDGRATIQEMAARAAELGLGSICITEHMDMDTPHGEDVWPEVDTEAYRSAFLAAQSNFFGILDMGFGIEYGMQAHLEARGRAYLARYPFDFVIASCHATHRKDPSGRAFYQGRPKKEAYREYFEDLGRCLALFDDYDVCGHIDYVVRYGPGKDEGYAYAQYADVIDPLLRTLVEKGKGVEVNTGAIRYGLRELNPCTDILRRYRQLGGEVVTVGSDAHRPQDIALGFDRAREVLLACGFTRYAVFRGRKPRFLPL